MTLTHQCLGVVIPFTDLGVATKNSQLYGIFLQVTAAIVV